MNHNLSNGCEFQEIINATEGAAASTDLTSDAVDTRGYDGCMLVCCFGAITAGAVTGVRAQQSSDDGSADAYADILGTAQVVADDDDNQLVIIDIYRPKERYLKLVVDRATQNAVVAYAMAIKYRAGAEPVTQGATVVGVERFNQPSEGTA